METPDKTYYDKRNAKLQEIRRALEEGRYIHNWTLEQIDAELLENNRKLDELNREA